jgi:hypothetical protein
MLDSVEDSSEILQEFIEKIANNLQRNNFWILEVNIVNMSLFFFFF